MRHNCKNVEEALERWNELSIDVKESIKKFLIEKEWIYKEAKEEYEFAHCFFCLFSFHHINRHEKVLCECKEFIRYGNDTNLGYVYGNHEYANIDFYKSQIELLHKLLSEGSDFLRQSICTTEANLLNATVKDYLYRDKWNIQSVTEPLDIEEFNEELINNIWTYVDGYKTYIPYVIRRLRISQEFYMSHIDFLGKYFNTLKKYNPELKEDGIKLFTKCTTEKESLEDIVKNSWELCAAKYLKFNLLIDYTNHFNFYRMDITKKEIIADEIFNNLDRCYNLIRTERGKAYTIKNLITRSNAYYGDYAIKEALSDTNVNNDIDEIFNDEKKRNLSSLYAIANFYDGFSNSDINLYYFLRDYDTKMITKEIKDKYLSFLDEEKVQYISACLQSINNLSWRDPLHDTISKYLNFKIDTTNLVNQTIWPINEKVENVIVKRIDSVYEWLKNKSGISASSYLGIIKTRREKIMRIGQNKKQQISEDEDLKNINATVNLKEGE